MSDSAWSHVRPVASNRFQGIPMNLVVIAIGLSMIVIAAAMLVRPAQFSGRMKGYAGTTSLYVFELAMRFTLGAVLILTAGDSRFPMLLQTIGGVSIAAGAILVMLPRVRFERLITWLLDRFGNYLRMGSLVPFLFGGFLIYAVL